MHPQFQRFNPVAQITLILAMCLALVSCGVSITVHSPESLGVYGEAPEFSVEYTADVPETPKLELNGTDIAEHFVFDTEAKTANASGSDVAHLIQAGKNTFVAEGLTVTFTIDDMAPVVHITQVSEGAGTLDLMGYLTDDAAAGTLSINGETVNLGDNGAYSVNVAEQPLMEFVGSDIFGNSATTTIARPTMQLPSLMGIQINDSAIDTVAEGIATIFTNIDNFSLIEYGLLGAPLYQDSVAVDFGQLDINMSLIGLQLSQVNFDMSADNGNADLDIDATINDITIDVYIELSGDWGLFLPLTGTITANRLNFSADAVPEVIAGQIETSLANINASFSNDFALLIPGLPSWLTPTFDTISGSLDNSLDQSIVASILPPVLGDLFGSIAGLELEIDLAGSGSTLSVDTDTETFAVSAGNLLMSTAGNFSAPLADGVSPTLGSHYQATSSPELPTNTPSGQPYDIGIAVSTNMLNRIMLAAYHAGTMNMEVITAVPALPTFTIRAVLNPSSAPYISLGDANSSAATAHMQDLDLMIEYSAAPGEYQMLFTGVVDIDVPYSMSPTNDGGVGIELGSGVNVRLVSVAEDETGALGGAWILESLIASAIPQALQGSLQSIAVIPTPTIDGFDLPISEFWISEDEDHLVMGGVLSTP